MGIIIAKGKSRIGTFFHNKAYWAAKLKDPDAWVCELDPVDTLQTGEHRNMDWTLDLVSTGDVKRITELWLFCPPNQVSPLGNTARLPITEPGTAFLLKVGGIAPFQLARRNRAVLIGRVDDKRTGDCTCFIWDAELRVMSTPWHSNVNAMGSWREGIAPLGAVSHTVVGLNLT